MKQATVIFIFGNKENNTERAKPIEIKYDKFSDLTSKINEYRENGIIDTYDYNATMLDPMSNLLELKPGKHKLGTFVPKEDIKGVIVKFPYKD